MTFNELSQLMFAIKGGPRVVIFEEGLPADNRLAFVFHMHRKFAKKFWSIDWNQFCPIGVELEFRSRSHAWLKKHSIRNSLVSCYPAHSRPEI